MRAGLHYSFPPAPWENQECPTTTELIELLTHAFRCARENDFFTAGAWWNQAVMVKDRIESRRKMVVAEKLLEAVCQAISSAQDRHVEALHLLRASGAERSAAVLMGLGAEERGDDCDLLTGLPDGGWNQGAQVGSATGPAE